MSSELKSFPASDLKLQKLRSSGEIPYSVDVSTFSVVLGAFIGLCVLFTSGLEIVVGFMQEAFVAHTGVEGKDLELVEGLAMRIRETLGLTLWMFVLVFIPMMGIVLLVGMLQTRFLFLVSLIKLDFGRVFRLQRALVSGMFSRLIAGLVQVGKVLGWVVVSAIILRYVFFQAGFEPVLRNVLLFGGDELMPPPSIEQGELSGCASPSLYPCLVEEVEDARGLMIRFWGFALAFSFFIAVISWLAVLISFRRAHRMSRSEVEAEYREMEAAPEFRSAHRELNLGDS